MSQLPVTAQQGALLEQVLIGGDLSRLNPQDKVMYYKNVCESMGLNPLTKPFEYIRLNGKEVLYALRSCTEQLRKIHGVSVIIVSREEAEGCYIVTARATDSKGRNDESIGAVPIKGLIGEARANALMKAETKAKRRVTLAICGLGMLDETEVDSIPGAYPSPINPKAGALQALPVARQETLQATAAEMRAFCSNGQEFEAYNLMETSGLDNDDRVALMTLLDSKTTKSIGRIRDAEKAQQQGTISEPQKKRLEARIKELALDRDEVKAYCLKEFGVSHFQELNREQYEALDKELGTINAAAPAQPTATLPAAPDAAATYISKERLQALLLTVEQKSIKARFSTRLASNKIASADQIPSHLVAAFEKWAEEAQPNKGAA